MENIESSSINDGYTLVVSEKLADAGFKELITREKDESVRYVKIPNTLETEELILPDFIQREEKILSETETYIKIPFDSVPIRLFDLQKIDTTKVKYPGLISNLQTSIEEVKRQNPQLVNLLATQDLQIEDILTVSMKESQIIILL